MKTFWDYVNKTESCWLWTGRLSISGYGQFRQNKRFHRAHRVAWEITNGAIPDGLCVCHKCDVRHCVNPEHLFIGTCQDNANDRVAKGRSHIPSKECAVHLIAGKFKTGTSNPRGKFTDEQIAEIRRRYQTETAVSLAKAFQTSETYIRL